MTASRPSRPPLGPPSTAWLHGEALRLTDFYRAAAIDVGFGWLDDRGAVRRDEPTHLWITARMTYSYSLAEMAGIPATAGLVDHGLQALNDQFRDHEHGGWFATVDGNGPSDDSKTAYDHSFVLLAAAAALIAGHESASDLLHDADRTMDERFWRPADSLAVERFDRAWTGLEPYRGTNSNMHLVEAYTVAFDATGRTEFLDRAIAAADRLRVFTAQSGGRMPEHFDDSWRRLPDYNRDVPDHRFRPYGTTVGHWIEWSRLLVQLAQLDDGVRTGWMLPAATALFDRAIEEGWDHERGGFAYTLDWDGNPVVTTRLHWVIAEAIITAARLDGVRPDGAYRNWYERFWDFADEHHIDRLRGSWRAQLDGSNRPTTGPWIGKPDLYHALQAVLASLTRSRHTLPKALALGEWR